MVLVIDDDVFVREAIIDILEHAAIPALTAVSGEEGITLYRQWMGKIDLVLLDMSMPGLNGAQTFDQLHQIDSEVRVLLSSGYTDQEINDSFPQNSLVGFLQKPYDLEKLVTTIRHHLS